MDVSINCPCPGTPHKKEGDTVTLRDTLSFREATAIRKSLAYVESDDEQGRALANLAALTESYLLFGISAWTLTDDEQKAIPVSHATIREHLLDGQPLQASIVADEADNLYAKVVLLPLLVRASTSSRPRPTGGSTSPISGSTQKRKTPSKRSSTSTTRTGGTGMTSASPGTGFSS